MCGIAGIYNTEGIDLNLIEKVSEVIRHRGPDDEGFLFLESNNKITSVRGEGTIKELAKLTHINDYGGSVVLSLIHRRLAIIDVSPTGHQPMKLTNAGLSIVYNGEIYNYLELRQELIKSGHQFITHSDTEVILKSYLHWSEKCVEHFVGMWSFAIMDQDRNVLFCSRDRFGIKPFYYFEKKNFFAFGSEIKALLTMPQVKPVLNQSNAIEFLVNGNQNFNGSTFFSGINELPPGHNLIYDLTLHKLKLKQYYKLNLSEKIENISHNNAVHIFNGLINDSVTLHLRSDVPVGSCLSGGLDSSTIIAHLAGKKLPYRLSTFTASFPGLPIDETSFIISLKNLYDFSDYYTYPDPNKLWDETDAFLWHQELPIQSTSPFAQWEVMKLAHHNQVKVLLDGQGMDEILGGYSEFIGAYLLGLLSGGNVLKLIQSVRYLRVNYRTSSLANELYRTIFYLVPDFMRRSIYSSQRIGPSIIRKEYNNLVKEVKFNKRISNSMRETSLLSINNILPVLLRYEDRNSMAFSIESRVPFLDHRLVEFCLNLPEDVKIFEGWTKYVLRKSSEPYLPDNITWRKEKLGFVTPEKIWIELLKNELIEYIKNQAVPDIINYDSLIRIATSGLNNNINLGEIWKIILFQRWYNVFCNKYGLS